MSSFFKLTNIFCFYFLNYTSIFEMAFLDKQQSTQATAKQYNKHQSSNPLILLVLLN
ncbi:unnamed protein product [Paramecium sonneborni]|uniref:Uncharacterized protein n=1 Tax=Paramecium sonneborni TaxID=65129 RepID=A0A8S1RNK1_9CILI|nr:unnamed protein product [Paramecium sonneborni]